MTAFAGALALALIGLPRPGAAAEAVVLQLHGPAQFEFAGYYAALWKGFYRDAGLTVEIKPGEVKPGAGSGEVTRDPVPFRGSHSVQHPGLVRAVPRGNVRQPDRR